MASQEVNVKRVVVVKADGGGVMLEATVRIETGGLLQREVQHVVEVVAEETMKALTNTPYSRIRLSTMKVSGV